MHFLLIINGQICLWQADLAFRTLHVKSWEQLLDLEVTEKGASKETVLGISSLSQFSYSLSG